MKYVVNYFTAVPPDSVQLFVLPSVRGETKLFTCSRTIFTRED
jgi:hypothetical protein